VDPSFSLAVVVDDDPDIALAARLALRDMFERIETLESPKDLIPLLKTESADAILLDLNFERAKTDGREGLTLLGKIMDEDPDAAVVIITAHGAVSIAVEAIKRGASDFVAKPWSNERLAATVRSAAALRRSRIDARVERSRASELVQGGETPLIGRSPSMERVRILIERAAPTDANVLILGENGTGKEIVAREIHRLSKRSGHPMVAIDLGATNETIFESELFGHVKGAFTGAAGERIGRLKAADHSTLVLDEVGNLPLHLQPKLLTALEQRQVVPVGANRPVAIDVRVVAATNLSDEQLADEKRFRQDLLFRLNTIEIHLPPLRARREDIPLLLDHYLALFARKYDRPGRLVPPAVLDVLVRHDWPGNVRALRHAAERAVIMADGDHYRVEDFPLPSRPEAASVPAPESATTLNLDQF
jgi:DNA-binding NtrC family response regulator